VWLFFLGATQMFNADEFKGGFDKTIKALAKAESLTKDTLRDLSRSLLFATQQTEDIGYINKTIGVLTPMNRKTAIMFFKEFSGLNFDDDAGSFSKKNKKKYEEIAALATAQLDDPHFNMWTWAEKNLTIEPKAFELAKVTQFAKSALKKAKDAGLSETDVLKAFFGGGFTAESIVAIMEQMAEQK